MEEDSRRGKLLKPQLLANEWTKQGTGLSLLFLFNSTSNLCRYHPDKTGRGDDDYVFLAVKKAYDVLSDHTKRSAYDSTALKFDDSIPPARSQLLEDPLLLYKDEDFYGLFGPVFERNLRFDANLRPDAPGLAKKKNRNNKAVGKNFKPPTLGDESTPMEEVHKFYEYWIHFESWRDFTAQATEELQVENELENAESRFEKRWLQREIDKRAKQLKTKENGRIHTLVERAMEADPRMRRERLEQKLAKERAKQEREEAAALKKKQAEEAKLEAERQEQAEKEQKAQEKAAREQEKKLIRKERQQLRRMTSSSFEEKAVVWADSYDMSLDVDYLCTSLNLDELRGLNKKYGDHNDNEAALQMIRDRAIQEREDEKNGTKKVASSSQSPEKNEAGSNPQSKKSANNSWTKDELSALARGVKKYPAGGANRWDQIALFVNNLCKQEIPRSKEECIQKYNEVIKSAAAPSQNNTQPSTDNSASNATAENGDSWTTDEDSLLQAALAQFPATMEKNARWSAIADAVPGKSKKQCVQRFKTIREALKQKK